MLKSDAVFGLLLNNKRQAIILTIFKKEQFNFEI